MACLVDSMGRGPDVHILIDQLGGESKFTYNADELLWEYAEDSDSVAKAGLACGLVADEEQQAEFKEFLDNDPKIQEALNF